MESKKKRFKIYSVKRSMDDCGRTTGTEKTFYGYTYAVSPKQAVNNVRFRERGGYKTSYAECIGDSSIVRTYVAEEG